MGVQLARQWALQYLPPLLPQRKQQRLSGGHWLFTPAAEVRPNSRNAGQLSGISEGSLGSPLSLETLLHGTDAFRARGQGARGTDPPRGRDWRSPRWLREHKAGLSLPTHKAMPRAREGRWVGADSFPIQSSRLQAPTLALCPFVVTPTS